jgi:hypothetical protein
MAGSVEEAMTGQILVPGLNDSSTCSLNIPRLLVNSLGRLQLSRQLSI